VHWKYLQSDETHFSVLCVQLELEKVKKRRLEREREKEERDREQEMMQRDKEAEYFREWEKQEDTVCFFCPFFSLFC